MIYLLASSDFEFTYFDFIDSDTLISSNYAVTGLDHLLSTVSTYLATSTPVDTSAPEGPFYRPTKVSDPLLQVAKTGLSNSDFTVLYSFEPSDFHLFLDQHPELFL